MTPAKRSAVDADMSVKDKLPRHIAVIMDGNNRWSRQNNKNGISGHRAGAVTARNMVTSCLKKKIEILTLFVFSSENWLRHKKEVNSLMALFLNVLQKNEISKLHKKNIKIKFIGSRERFTEKLLQLMDNTEKLTEKNSGMTVVVAADYGGHWDVTNSVRHIAGKVESGQIKATEINEALYKNIWRLVICLCLICVSGPVANNESVIFCCGNLPIRNFISQIHSGRILMTVS